MAPLWNGKTFAGRSLSTWIVQQGVPKNLKIQLLSDTSNRLEIFFSPRLRRSSTVRAVQRSTWLYDRVAMQCGKSCQLSYMHGTIVNGILHKSANNTQTKQANTKPRITPIRPTPPFFSSTSMATVHDGGYRFHQSPLWTKHCQSGNCSQGLQFWPVGKISLEAAWVPRALGGAPVSQWKVVGSHAVERHGNKQCTKRIHRKADAVRRQCQSHGAWTHGECIRGENQWVCPVRRHERPKWWRKQRQSVTINIPTTQNCIHSQWFQYNRAAGCKT